MERSSTLSRSYCVLRPAGSTEGDLLIRQLPFFMSALHAHALLECVENINQIALVVHHMLDVLVRGRDLIDHVGIFSTLDSSCLLHQVSHSESALCLPT